jgi:uncharacterized membrane protein HdeD (DUF308 family)
MSAKALETWSWVLIYGGLLLLCLGIFVVRGDAGLGYTLCAVGVVLTAAGIVLIARRARLTEPREPATSRKE